jgi:hypothetical protein
MSPATEKLVEVQDKVLEFVGNVEESLVDGLRTAVSKVEDRLPDTVKVPYKDKLPTADELVDNGYGFAGAVVKQGKSFADEVLDATAPVRSRFVDRDAKPVKSTTKKAA